MASDEPQRSDLLAKLAKRTDLLIAGLIAFQTLVPLSYYLGGDRSDERFAWRMFSTVRVESCAIAADEEVRGPGDSDPTIRPVDLGRTIHSAWQTALERDRTAVVKRFLALCCEQEDVESARLVRTCRAADGSMRDPEQVRMTCASGEIARSVAVAP